MFYLPKGDDLKRVLLHRQIWEEFNGHNVDKLVRKHQIGTQGIYKILKRQRALANKRMMRYLFDEKK